MIKQALPIYYGKVQVSPTPFKKKNTLESPRRMD